MALHDSPDGRYTHAIPATPAENEVVYDNVIVPGQQTVVWDRWTYEASLPPPTPDRPIRPILPDLPVLPIVPDRPPVGPNTLIQVTTAQDGSIAPRMYAYWSNAWIDADGVIWVFCGHDDGQPPSLFSIAHGVVTRRTWPFSYVSETEGWYWDREGWIYLFDGPRFRRVHPFTGKDHLIYDASPWGAAIWQPHSSVDGLVHSATVKDASYAKTGTLVWHRGEPRYYAALGDLDESRVTSDGAFAIITETINGSEDNRVIRLATAEERVITDAARAVGHGDCGPSLLIGEADKPDPGACVLWNLQQPLTIDRCRVLFTTLDMGYVSYRAGRCLHSDYTDLAWVDLVQGGRTPFFTHGNEDNSYDGRVKANLDPSGTVACMMLTKHGRRDVYVLIP